MDRGLVPAVLDVLTQDLQDRTSSNEESRLVPAVLEVLTPIHEGLVTLDSEESIIVIDLVAIEGSFTRT